MWLNHGFWDPFPNINFWNDGRPVQSTASLWWIFIFKRICEHFSNYWNVTCDYDSHNGDAGMEGSMVGDLLLETLVTHTICFFCLTMILDLCKYTFCFRYFNLQNKLYKFFSHIDTLTFHPKLIPIWLLIHLWVSISSQLC